MYFFDFAKKIANKICLHLYNHIKIYFSQIFLKPRTKGNNVLYFTLSLFFILLASKGLAFIYNFSKKKGLCFLHRPYLIAKVF